ncbi:CBS domain-containing protein [Candidatus Mcinerneyibacteriota bacterium]|nr:CBS domain-containing protein [Candidatus Mcinerneyibacteriota bacterium]
MRVIISHEGMDFDSLAGMAAARKLYGDGIMLSLGKKRDNVALFLKMHYKYFTIEKFSRFRDLNEITEIVMVDTRRRQRLGRFADFLDKTRARIVIFDHHPGGDISGDESWVESTGAVTTLLVERLLEKEIHINPVEASLFLLGIYEDTGALTYSTTTDRDVAVAAELMKRGARPENILAFLNREFNPLQQRLQVMLKSSMESYTINGLPIHIATADLDEIVGGISDILQRLHVREELQTSFAIVGMGRKTHMVGKTSGEDLNMNEIMAFFGGGGHIKSASATLINISVREAKEKLVSILEEKAVPGVRAFDIMSRPVFTLKEDEKLGEVIEKIIYSHYRNVPVEDGEGRITGWVSKEKIMQMRSKKQLHIPVKGIMDKRLLFLDQNTPADQVRETFFRENVSLIIVTEGDKMVGVITPSDVVHYLHAR